MSSWRALCYPRDLKRLFGNDLSQAPTVTAHDIVPGMLLACGVGVVAWNGLPYVPVIGHEGLCVTDPERNMTTQFLLGSVVSVTGAKLWDLTNGSGKTSEMTKQGYDTMVVLETLDHLKFVLFQPEMLSYVLR